ncbi:MAG: Coenzyme F420 hydrogenase/dehydrogenase, beta subunit C-terminal domain [Actinomycetota bacterium]
MAEATETQQQGGIGPPPGKVERKHWRHLYQEVVATQICVGCSACVVACPHGVIEMQDFDPVQVGEENAGGGPDYCVHGEKSCSLCAMACLRLDPDFDAIEQTLFGRRRRHPSEPWGMTKEMWLARATDEEIRKRAQDGGAVTAIMGWMLETGEIDGTCVAKPREDKPWLDEPFVATSKEDLLPAAGSRYTYCSTPLALKEASKAKIKKMGVVGVSCESTALREMAAEGVRRWSRMVKFVAGLMCNETFAYEPFIQDIVKGRYGIDLDKITKINVKGDVYVSIEGQDDVVIPLDECKPYANAWCHHCPDFAAEHADISFGGLGMSGWTMCLIRTEYGEDVWNRALEAGVIETREADEEPTALKVLDRLAKKQRKRVGLWDPHALGRWPVKETLERLRREYLEEAPGNGKGAPPGDEKAPASGNGKTEAAGGAKAEAPGDGTAEGSGNGKPAT